MSCSDSINNEIINISDEYETEDDNEEESSNSMDIMYYNHLSDIISRCKNNHIELYNKYKQYKYNIDDLTKELNEKEEIICDLHNKNIKLIKALNNIEGSVLMTIIMLIMMLYFNAINTIF